MDSIVKAPGEAVEQLLDIQAIHLVAKSGEDHFADVCHTISVSVIQKQNVGRSSNKNTALPTNHRRRPWQIICEDGAFIEVTISIAVFEQTHPPEMLIPPLGVIPHFDDKQAAALVKGHGHRIHDQWLGGDDIECESGLNAKGAQGPRRL